MQLQIIQKLIYEIRGQKVMLDFNLAPLYATETRTLKQAVKRNMERFLKDFMFQLNKSEWQQLITIGDNLPEGVKFTKPTDCRC
jgi:ORF6N domain